MEMDEEEVEARRIKIKEAVIKCSDAFIGLDIVEVMSCITELLAWTIYNFNIDKNPERLESLFVLLEQNSLSLLSSLREHMDGGRGEDTLQ